MSGINWSAVRFKRRRPSWRYGFGPRGMASMTPPILIASNFARAGKDLKGTKVSATRQGELRELTDADVVRLAQQGDAVAFERIYRLHSRKVYALCLRMVSDRSEAEDLTQDVFLQLFRKINMFRGDSAFSTWLHRMSFNIVLMRFRKKNTGETILGGHYESRRGFQR